MKQSTNSWPAIDLKINAQLWRTLERANHHGIGIIGNASNHSDFLNSVCQSWRRGEIPLILAGSQHAPNLESINPPTGAIIGFLTSGTTSSSPKIIWKSWQALNSEALVLIKTFGITPASRILSLVPPIHIYGFIYGCLVPCLSDSTLITCGDWSRPLMEPEVLPENVDVIIAVPPLWSLLEGLLPALDPRLILSSGAPFGERRAELAMTLRERENLGFTLVDILGSTETGGIGFRCVAGERTDSDFIAFEGVVLTPPSGDNSSWRVESPFTDHNDIPVADVFTLAGHNKFQYGGRTDRVVKIGARRFSLTEIESALSRCAGGSTVTCLFCEAAHTPKGGELHAFMEGHSLDTIKILKRFQVVFPHLPLPGKVHVLDKLPQGAMGKSGRADLERLLEADKVSLIMTAQRLIHQ